MPQAVETSGALTPEQLFEALSGEGASEPLTVLDVRNQDEFASWRIEGRRPVRLVNIPYFDFIEDPEGSVAKVPRESGALTVVCAKGGSSALVVGILGEAGIPARNLDGGMVAWGDLHVAREVVVWPDRDAALVQVQRVGKACLSYLLVSRGEALVVDPSRHVDRYLRLAADRAAGIAQVIDTHLHADHVSGARALAARTGATYRIAPKDVEGATFAPAPLRDGGEIRVGDARVKVLALGTPGHTPGSTCLLVNGQALLAGDTLFVGSVGRPDLGGRAAEWAIDLYDSLFRRLAGLPDATLVLPAHYAGQTEVGPDGRVATRLGDLRRTNPALQAASRDRFLEFVMAHMAAEPEGYQEIRQINLGRTSAPEDRVVELELGPNRCALGGRKAA